MDQLTLVVAGVALRGDRVLLGRRQPGGHLAGLWEFPGGKVDPGEDPRDALRREWKEELGVELRRAEAWTFAHWCYPEKTVLILFYNVEITEEPRPCEGQEIAWTELRSLRDLPMPGADAGVIEDLLR